MKTIRSLLLCIAGSIYCFLFSLIIATGLIVFDSRTICPAVRILARIQLLIVGNHESLFDVFAIPTALPITREHLAKADILPFAVSGLYEYRSKQGWHLNPRTAHVAFGTPIPYDSYKTVDQTLRKVRREIIKLKDNRG